jgi:Mor family transcriptional regulator
MVAGLTVVACGVEYRLQETKMPHPRALSDADENKIVSAYEQGTQATELAKSHSVHPDTIRNIVRRRGGALRARGGSLPGSRRR